MNDDATSSKSDPISIGTASSRIPSDVLSSILCRLPVKNLLQFRCVSKSWHSLIDNPVFVKLHLQHSTQLNSNRSLILRCKNETGSRFYLMDFDSLDNFIELNNPINDDMVCIYHCKLIGCCNGLIALSGYKGKVDLIVFWNPCTGKYQKTFLSQKNLDCDGVLEGFGYDSVNDDYKFVRIWWNPNDICEVRVYSLKTDSWHSVNYSRNNSGYHFTGVFLRNKLHWLMEDHLIMTFDLATEEFDEISKPDNGDTDIWFKLSELGGCLCISSYNVPLANGNSTRLWILKNYEVKDSWTEIVLKDSYHTVFPIAYSNNEDKVFLKSFCDTFVWYDLEMKLFENTINLVPKTSGILCGYEVEVFVGSLVPLKSSRVNEEK